MKKCTFAAGMLVRKQAICAKFWRKSNIEQVEILRTLFSELNAIYEVDNIPSVTIPDPVDGQKVSLMTFLHNYAVILANIHCTHDDSFFDYIINWSHTVFFIASRSIYRSSLEKGLFEHTPCALLEPVVDGSDASFLNAFMHWHVAQGVYEDMPVNFLTPDMHSIVVQ